MVEQSSGIAPGNAKPAHLGASRMSSLDVMKCLAAFCVVWIHFGSHYMDPIVRCAVPVFFIITGYYYPMMVGKGHFWKHFRKLLVMTVCSSALYGVYELQKHISLGDLDEWLHFISRLRHICAILLNISTLFGFHLWYFYAVLYGLVIFYFADKWKLTKYLRYATPILLLILFAATFSSLPCSYYRNFLFMGLPCMMIGRLISEGKDKSFSFLANHRYMWLYAALSLLLSYAQKFFLSHLYSGIVSRDIYVFTLPLVIPFFYWCLRHPDFGRGAWLAVIGRKYSAYIYIIHVIVAYQLLPRVEALSPPIGYTIPFLIFGTSLCVAWLFDKILRTIRALSDR